MGKALRLSAPEVGAHARLTHRWAAAALGAVTAAALVGAVVPTPAAASTARAASGSPITLHAELSQSGEGGAYGSAEADALKIVAAQVNKSGGIKGHQLQLDLADNQTTPSLAVSLATPWVSSGAQFMIAGSLTSVDAPVDALAKASGPFIYDMSPGISPKPGSMVFSAGISSESTAQATLNYLKAKHLDNVAMISTTDTSGVENHDEFKQLLGTSTYSSIHLVADQTVDPTAVSDSTQLSVIKAANPQAIVVFCNGTPFGTALNGMSQLGMGAVPTFTTPGNDGYSSLKSLASVMPKSLEIPVAPLDLAPSALPAGPVEKAVATFDRVVKAAGQQPGDDLAYGYQSGMMIVDALKKYGPKATSHQILTYMEHLKNFPGIFGVYNTSVSNHRGVGTSDVYMAQWTGSGFKRLSGAGG